MNPELYAWLLGGIAVGAAVAGLPSSRRVTAPRQWPSIVGLAGLIAALLAVGVVSGTLVRHVIQLAPAFVAMALVLSGSPIGRAATLPVLTFWAALMTVIWLFLLGVRQLIGGHFTAVEVGLTIAIAAACLAGLVGGAAPTAHASPVRRCGVACVFGLLQLSAFWVSLRP